jgi:hypothetical protein
MLAMFYRMQIDRETDCIDGLQLVLVAASSLQLRLG